MALIGAFSSLFTEMMMPPPAFRQCAGFVRDAAGDIEFRTDGYTRLTHLTVVVGIARIDGGAAGAYFGVKLLGKVEQHVKFSRLPMP